MEGIRMWACIGAVLGGVVGFLLRPSVPLLGQLPLETVLSRGSNLSGLDLLLKGVAEQSFNYLVVGIILGAVVGLVVGKLSGKRA
jgi:hypothetical protein